MKQEEYIKRWLEGSLNEDEKKEFAQSDDYLFIQRLDKSLQSFKAPDYDPSGEVHRIPVKKKTTIIIPLFASNRMLKLAASVLLFMTALGVFYISFQQNQPKEIFAERKSELVLPDQSTVQLNAFSKLVYEEDNWNNNRSVSLDGEAYFDVAKGSKFDVQTSSGTVSVLGTKFNIKARRNFFEVSCYEGQVKISSDDKEILLYPNEAWRKFQGKSQMSKNLTDSNPDWLRGESQFRSIPLKQVIDELERQYNLKITAASIDQNRLYTGTFVHNNINLALKSVCLPLNLSYKLEQDRVMLYTNQ